MKLFNLFITLQISTNIKRKEKIGQIMFYYDIDPNKLAITHIKKGRITSLLSTIKTYMRPVLHNISGYLNSHIPNISNHISNHMQPKFFRNEQKNIRKNISIFNLSPEQELTGFLMNLIDESNKELSPIKDRAENIISQMQTELENNTDSLSNPLKTKVSPACLKLISVLQKDIAEVIHFIFTESTSNQKTNEQIVEIIVKSLEQKIKQAMPNANKSPFALAREIIYCERVNKQRFYMENARFEIESKYENLEYKTENTNTAEKLVTIAQRLASISEEIPTSQAINKALNKIIFNPNEPLERLESLPQENKKISYTNYSGYYDEKEIPATTAKENAFQLRYRYTRTLQQDILKFSLSPIQELTGFLVDLIHYKSKNMSEEKKDEYLKAWKKQETILTTLTQSEQQEIKDHIENQIKTKLESYNQSNTLTTELSPACIKLIKDLQTDIDRVVTSILKTRQIDGWHETATVAETIIRNLENKIAQIMPNANQSPFTIAKEILYCDETGKNIHYIEPDNEFETESENTKYIYDTENTKTAKKLIAIAKTKPETHCELNRIVFINTTQYNAKTQQTKYF